MAYELAGDQFKEQCENSALINVDVQVTVIEDSRHDRESSVATRDYIYKLQE